MRRIGHPMIGVVLAALAMTAALARGGPLASASAAAPWGAVEAITEPILEIAAKAARPERPRAHEIEWRNSRAVGLRGHEPPPRR